MADAVSFDEAELDLNEELHRIHQLVAASGPATGALSYVTEDRMDTNANICRSWR